LLRGKGAIMVAGGSAVVVALQVGILVKLARDLTRVFTPNGGEK